MDLSLNSGLDVASLARAFAETRRLRIPDILTQEAAEALATALEAFDGWALSVNAGDEQFEVPLRDRRAADSGRQSWIDDARVDGESRRVQYLYDTRRLPADAEQGAPMDIIGRMPAFLNSAAFLDLARAITGDPRIEFADAQATRYRPGQVLTVHTDELGDKGRLYAYVLNVTREWRADWGGVLIFPDSDGHVQQGFVPAFNGLNLFAVPMPHAVTQVASFSPRDRYAITGWLRTSQPL